MPFASFLTSLFGSPEKKQKLKTVKTVSATLPEYLNWNHFEKRNGIVYLATKNSMLLVFMKLNPHTDYYSPTGDEDVAETWNRLLMTLPDKTSFWYEFSKGLLAEESGYIGSSDLYSNPADRELEKLREEEFRNHAKSYQQKRILCIAFVPSVDKAGLSEFSFESFEKTLLDIKGRFQAVKIDTELMDETAICTYLHDCISTKHYQIAEPSAASHALSDALWDDDIDSTLVPLKLGERYISVITIDDFPVTGTFGEMLSGITGIPGDIRWVTRYTTASAESGRKFIDDMRRKYFSRRFSNPSPVFAKWRRTSTTAGKWPCSKNSKCSRSARSTTISANSTRFPPESISCRRSTGMKRVSWPDASEKFSLCRRLPPKETAFFFNART